jgi:c-di-GMP-binding flagellar brake protein YcgR
MPSRFPGFTNRQLVLLETDVEGAIVAWRATVEAAQGERLLVAVVDDPIPDELREGSAVSVTSVTSTSVFTVDATVTRRSETTLAVSLRDDRDPVQRRQYVRVAARAGVRGHRGPHRPTQVTPVGPEGHRRGGGGMALEADVIAPRDAIVVVSLAIPDDRPLVAIGTVLDHATRRERHARDEAYLLRVGFSAISDRDRERLVRFVFTCMREDRSPDAPRR